MKESNDLQVETGPMFLIYRDERGNLHAQPWQDVQDVGGLIDPDSGDDRDIIGWMIGAQN